MPAPHADPVEHVVVDRDASCFAAWPFNVGLWRFADDEVVVGYCRARIDYGQAEQVQHGYVGSHGDLVLARSPDGGRTWPAELRQTPWRGHPVKAMVEQAPRAHDPAGRRFDPGSDGYCLFAAGLGLSDSNSAYVRISTDRGHTWSDPRRLPAGMKHSNGYFTGIYCRPSYVLRPDGVLLLFADGSPGGSELESRPLVYASTDGGASWGIVGQVLMRDSRPLAICASPALLPDGTLLIAVRRQWDTYSGFTEVYASEDGGLTWTYRSRASMWGAPATLTSLPDGRIVCVYGYRRPPYGIRATISEDAGRHWLPERILRDDGGSWDLGYPRTALLSDGTLLTVYYFNEQADPMQQNGGVRHIGATRWRV